MTVQPLAELIADKPLAGRVAIVTGSTSGIGLGIARALAAAGADLVINGIGDAGAIEAVRSELEQANGVRVLFDGANLMQPEGAVEMVDKALLRFGRVDILVNNAGIQHVSPIEDFPAEKWDAIIALNLSAAFHAIRTAFGPMKEAGWGRIINVASAHGLVASPFKSAYVAAKHGIVGLTKTVALEGARFGVTCNAICPGYVWTPLVENQIGDTAAARGISREEVVENVLLAAQPSKKFATVDELGALAVFLCSDGGQSITGTALPVDGGWTAQ
ncbi:3-hydroxybutyrate dehydrogenase [Sphingopyxis sp. XHP0097]|uniref:3-hydroxybutyrate dehydrogenase n=1 Tax=Sphingopyxis jiangsuensis TaxID=2871171 RepID=A0ABS7MCF6_9SPHN|nr:MULTISPECIES: 3-hydroxybutyrate dehydrogenase [Sphingopyxis]MBY4636720.1 3-hydroxybutyrate dehydrogenase [Sphingopyxis jiangsuensis]